MSITLLQGDCRQVLSTLPAQSVQTCVCSPPYYGLRNYSVEGPQIGLERTPAEYVAALVEVFRAVKRVLRDDGTLWVNLGDSYGEGKQLLGIPWRVAFALQRDGAASPETMDVVDRMISAITDSYESREEWPTRIRREVERLEREYADAQRGAWILRSDCVWSKPNPMPESVTDRPTRSHEYIFLFAKQAHYYYDSAAIAEPSAPSSISRAHLVRKAAGKTIELNKAGGNGLSHDNTSYGTGRNRRTVWTVATRPYSAAHFAVFPEQLIEPCILAGSSPRACEVCGAPWERHIEKKTNTLPVEERTGRQSHNGTPPQQSGWFWKPPEITDFGWRPTCAHDANAGTGRCVVLDPFVGSGTTCRVAERYGRDSIGIDLGYQSLQEQRTDGVQIEMVDLL